MNDEGKKPEVRETKEIAQLFGVSVRRIQQLTQDGILDTVAIKEGKRTVRRYELEATIQSYVKYLSDKAYGKKGRTDKEQELKEEKIKAETELKKSQMELHKLKTNIASGAYISKEEVKVDYCRFFISFKKFAMAIPVRISGIVSGYVNPEETRKIEKDLADEVHRLLTTFVVSGVDMEDVKRTKGKRMVNAEETENK